MTHDLFIRLLMMVFVLMAIGAFACLPLFKWKLTALMRSALFVKIVWWLPIFVFLLTILYGGFLVALPVFFFVIGLGVREVVRNDAWKWRSVQLYFLLFTICMAHLAVWFLALPNEIATRALASVAVVSVMSDVIAFFAGNYFRKHPLPVKINERKSWEGVAGQIVGAVIGGIVAYYVVHLTIPPILIVLIGVASALGDVINSAVKRIVGIKDWGRTIPGHGGVLDRLSSMSLSIAVSFWFIYIAGL